MEIRFWRFCSAFSRKLSRWSRAWEQYSSTELATTSTAVSFWTDDTYTADPVRDKCPYAHNIMHRYTTSTRHPKHLFPQHPGDLLGVLEAPREVPNPYNKTPQSSAWVISTLTNLGTFSKVMWKDCCTKLHYPNNTSSPTSDLDADIANCYANPQDLLAADRQLRNRPISKVLKFKRTHKTKFIRSIRPSSLSCRAPQSAVYYTAFLRAVSSHSCTH
jgi:hypothetical protein